MKTITLTIIKHKNSDNIKISFNYDYKLKEYIKIFPMVKWSATHNAFYIPFSKENTNKLYLYLKKYGCKINYLPVVNTINNRVEKEHPKQIHINLKDFENWLIQMRYSENTITTYLAMIRVFFRFYPEKKISDITKKDVENFNTNYILKKGYSSTFQNQLINAIKLFYTYYTNNKLNLKDLDRPKKSKKLPSVLSLEEVKQILSSIRNIKHKTLLSLVYSCGLRIGEAVNLKLNAIDFDRNLIHIKAGKGKKDRYIPLSFTMKEILFVYITAYNPKIYLFNGQNNSQYSTVSAREILKKSLKRTNIKKHVTLHTLRHSYATHLLENGTDIRFIQELLGHNSPNTTMIYTHISATSLQKIKNPFDDFNI